MKKKIFILFIIVMLSTGCSVNYNIIVDKNFNITEKMDIVEKNSSFDIQYDNPKAGVEDIFQNIDKSLKYKIDDYKINRGINSINFNIKNNYSDETEYNNSIILKNLNGKVEIYKNTDSNKNTSVFQVMINYDFFDLINTNKYSNIGIDDMNVNITFPYKVVSSNADFVKENVYTWNIKKNIKSRSFYIEYNENELQKKGINIVWIIVILVLIVLVFLIIILFAKKKKKFDL